MTHRNNNQEYNGHRNWEYWNVSLWLNNEVREFDHFFADLAANNEIFERNTRYNPHEMTRVIMRNLHIQPTRNFCTGRITSYARTPDGARYTIGAVFSAVRNRMEDYNLI